MGVPAKVVEVPEFDQVGVCFEPELVPVVNTRVERHVHTPLKSIINRGAGATVATVVSGANLVQKSGGTVIKLGSWLWSGLTGIVSKIYKPSEKTISQQYMEWEAANVDSSQEYNEILDEKAAASDTPRVNPDRWDDRLERLRRGESVSASSSVESSDSAKGNGDSLNATDSLQKADWEKLEEKLADEPLAEDEEKVSGPARDTSYDGNAPHRNSLLHRLAKSESEGIDPIERLHLKIPHKKIAHRENKQCSHCWGTRYICQKGTRNWCKKKFKSGCKLVPDWLEAKMGADLKKYGETRSKKGKKPKTMENYKDEQKAHAKKHHWNHKKKQKCGKCFGLESHPART